MRKKGKAKEGEAPAEALSLPEVNKATLERFIGGKAGQVQFIIRNLPDGLKSQESNLLELYAQICQDLGYQHQGGLFKSPKKLVWKDAKMGNIRDPVIQEMLKKLQPGASTSAPPKQGESSTSVSGEAHKGDDLQVVEVTDRLAQLTLDVMGIEGVVKGPSNRTLDSFSNEALVAFLLQPASKVTVRDEKILHSAVEEFLKNHKEVHPSAFPVLVNSIAKSIVTEQKAAQDVAAAEQKAAQEIAAAKEETAAEREERIAAEQKALVATQETLIAQEGLLLREDGLPDLEVLKSSQASGAKANPNYKNVNADTGNEQFIVTPVENFTLELATITSDNKPILVKETKQLKEIPLRSRIWNQAKSSRDEKVLEYERESDIGGFVKGVINDILRHLGLEGLIQLQREGGAGDGGRSDFLLLYNKHRQPMGAVEVKSPIKGKAIVPQLHLPQLGTYLKNLHELFGVPHPIGILTTFKEWFFCTLDGDGDVIFGKSVSCDIQPWNFDDPKDRYAPFFKKDNHTFYQVRPRKLVKGGQHEKHEEKKQKEVEEDLPGVWFEPLDETGKKEITITLCLSKLYSGTQVADALASVLLRLASLMSLPKQERAYLPLMRFAADYPTRYSMIPFPEKARNLDDLGLPMKSAAQFYLLAPVSHGAEGQVWLACSVDFKMCALKLFFKEVSKGRKEQEMILWNKVFREMFPSGGVRKSLAFWVKDRRDALVTPFLDFHYDPKDLSEDKKAAVRKSIEVLAKNGYLHTDLAWRNVGFAYHDGKTYAFLIDMPYDETPHGLNRQTLEEQMLDDLEQDK